MNFKVYHSSNNIRLMLRVMLLLLIAAILYGAAYDLITVRYLLFLDVGVK